MKRQWPVPGIAGASIREVSDLPDVLAGAVPVGPYSVAKPGALLRVVPGLARFLVRDGSTIDVAPESGADGSAIEAFLQGAVLGALIHQRGELPLHASTLVPPNEEGAVAIAGHSGAGKSTLAYELVRRGWSILSDDLTRVTVTDRVLAWPGRGTIKLWKDACLRFGLSAAGLVRVPDERDKYLVPLQARQEAAPLAAIVHLERRAGDGLSSVAGISAMAMLAELTYRLSYVAALGQTGQHLRAATGVLARTKLFKLETLGTVVTAANIIEGRFGAR